MYQNFMILQNSHEDSKFISFRNQTYEKDHIEKIEFIEIPQNTMSQQFTQLSYAQFSDRSKNTLLIEQLKKQLSNQKQQNLPRQINSVFNEYDGLRISKKYNFVSQDEIYNEKKREQEIVIEKNYDLPKPSTFNNYIQQKKDIPKKTLKQAIYQRLQNEKSVSKCNINKNPNSIKQNNLKYQKPIQIKQNMLTSTSNSKTKTLIKQKIFQNIPKLQQIYQKNSLFDKQRQSSKKQKIFLSNIHTNQNNTQNNQNNNSQKNFSHNKYKTLLKNSSKQNFNLLNKFNPLELKNSKLATTTKAQSYVNSIKLRQTKINQALIYDNSKISYDQKILQNKQRNLSNLPFHERQNRLLNSKTEKILRFSQQKKIAEMQQCTFRPKFTNYKKERSPKNHYNSYAELYKKKSNKVL